MRENQETEETVTFWKEEHEGIEYADGSDPSTKRNNLVIHECRISKSFKHADSPFKKDECNERKLIFKIIVLEKQALNCCLKRRGVEVYKGEMRFVN